MADPLISDLGTLVKDDMIDDILERKYIPETCNQFAGQLIEILKQPTTKKQIPPTKYYVGINNHIEGWKRQKEKIASDYKGQIFSHYNTGPNYCTVQH